MLDHNYLPIKNNSLGSQTTDSTDSLKRLTLAYGYLKYNSKITNYSF